MTRRGWLASWIGLLAVPALAGVVVEQRIESDGFGSNHAGRMSGTTKLVVQGPMSRQETTSEFTGKLLRKFSGEMAGLSITRLDRGLVWIADPGRGEYSEITFEQLRAQREEALTRWSEGGSEESAPAQGTYEWTPPEVSVTETGRQETIAGLEARLTEVRVRSVGTHVETGETCKVTWELDQWLGEETAASKQLLAYHREYAKQLGFSPKERQLVGDQLSGMLASFGEGMQPLVDHLKSAEGTALRHTMRLVVGGSCGGPTPSAETPTSGVKKTFAKFRGKLGGKKKNKPSTAQPVSQTGEPLRQLFAVSVTTTSIREEATDAAVFAEPTQLKKVER